MGHIHSAVRHIKAKLLNLASHDSEVPIAQPAVYTFYGFLKTLYQHNKLTFEQMDCLGNLPPPAQSFFPQVGYRFTNPIEVDALEQEYQQKIALFLNGCICFEDVAGINADDHPLLSKEARERILQGSSLSEELSRLDNLKECQDFYYYKQLKKAIEAHHRRIKQALNGKSKAEKMTAILAAIDQAYYQKPFENVYDAYKKAVQQTLLPILEQKRLGLFSPKSYKAITALIFSLDKKRMEQSMLRFSLLWHSEPCFLGDRLLNLLLSNDFVNIHIALSCILYLDCERKLDFITEYSKAFQFAFNEAMLTKAATDHQHMLLIFRRIVRHIKAQKMDVDLKSWRWQRVLKYILTPNEADFYHGYYLPVQEEAYADQTASKRLLTPAKIDAAWRCQVNENKNSGPYEGVYMRPYVRWDGELFWKKSLLVQPKQKNGTISKQATLHEFWIGYLCHALAPEHNAPVELLVPHSDSRAKVFDDVYLEYTCFDDFLNRRELMKDGKNCLDVREEKVVIQLGEREKKYPLKDLAAVMFPRLLLGVSLDGDNIGFVEKDADFMRWASFGLSQDYRQTPSPYAEKHPWLDVNPFFRKHKPMFSVEAYLATAFIHKAQRLIHTAAKRLAPTVDDAIDHLKNILDEKDILQYLANCFQIDPTDKEGFSSIGEFRLFYLQTLANRLQAMAQWVFELQLWRMANSKIFPQLEVAMFIEENAGHHYQMAYYPLDRYHCVFHSKNLRFLQEIYESEKYENPQWRMRNILYHFSRFPKGYCYTDQNPPSWRQIQQQFIDEKGQAIHLHDPVLASLQQMALAQFDNKAHMLDELRRRWLVSLKNTGQIKKPVDRACCLRIVGTLYAIPEQDREEIVPLLLEQAQSMRYIRPIGPDPSASRGCILHKPAPKNDQGHRCAAYPVRLSAASRLVTGANSVAAMTPVASVGFSSRLPRPKGLRLNVDLPPAEVFGSKENASLQP